MKRTEYDDNLTSHKKAFFLLIVLTVIILGGFVLGGLTKAQIDNIPSGILNEASRGNYREALQEVDAYISLLTDDGKTREASEITSHMKIPLLYAWRQQIAATRTSDALALDQAITMLLISNYTEKMQLQSRNDLNPQEIELVTIWLSIQLLDYGLKEDSRCPQSLLTLMAFTYRPSKSTTIVERTEMSIARLKDVTVANEHQNDHIRRLALIPENMQFFELLRDVDIPDFMDNVDSKLVEAHLAEDYQSHVSTDSEASVGAVLDYLLEEARTFAQSIEDKQIRIQQITEQLGSFPDKKLMHEIEKKRSLSKTRQAQARLELEKQLAEEAELTHDFDSQADEYERKYEKLLTSIRTKSLGPKRIYVKNDRSEQYEISIAFYLRGQWHNADFSSRWRMQPGEESSLGYKGQSIVCSRFKALIDRNLPPSVRGNIGIFNMTATTVVGEENANYGEGKCTIRLLKNGTNAFECTKHATPEDAKKLEQLASLSPKGPDLLSNGVRRLEVGSLDRALSDFNTLLETYPKFTLAKYYRAMTLMMKKKVSEATREMKQLLLLDPYFSVADIVTDENMAEIGQYKSNQLIQRGDDEAAAECYFYVLLKEPQNDHIFSLLLDQETFSDVIISDAYLLRARAWIEHKRFKEAIECCQQAIECFSQNDLKESKLQWVTPYMLQGMAYEALAEYDIALKAYERAKAVGGESFDYRESFGVDMNQLIEKCLKELDR